MKIIFDVQACKSILPFEKRNESYWYSIIQAMNGFKANHQLEVFLSQPNLKKTHDTEPLFSSILEEKKIHHHSSLPISEKDNFQRQKKICEANQFLLYQRYLSLSPDVLHFTEFFNGFSKPQGTLLDSKYMQKLKTVLFTATLHSIRPIFQQMQHLAHEKNEWIYYHQLRTLKACDLLLTTSESSRRDIMSWLDLPADKVINISIACDTHFQPTPMSHSQTKPLKSHYGIQEKFIFCMLGADFYQKAEWLISGFAEVPKLVRQSFQLLLSVPSCHFSKTYFNRLLKQKGLSTHDVIWIDSTCSEDRASLYHACDLFIFPSREGDLTFLLEAMQCGTPVIGADVSEIREMMDYPDAYFRIGSHTGITECLNTALSSEAFRQGLSQHGLKRSRDFSWKKTGQLMLDALNEAKKRKEAIVRSNRTTIPRLKIAYFSPLPDQASGVADYSADLLPFLTQYFDMDLFVGEHPTHYYNNPCKLKIFHYKEYIERRHDYDLALYHMGNSPFHDYMYECIVHYGGAVVLHDFFLSGLLLQIGRTRKDYTLFDAAAMHSHQASVSHITSLHEKEQRRDELNQQYPLNLKILESADLLIAHSTHTIELMEQFYSGQQIKTPIKIIRQMHLAHEPAPLADRLEIKKKLGFSASDFIICSFGFMGYSKLNDVLLEAFAYSSRLIPHGKLVFVGGAFTSDFIEFMEKSIIQYQMTEKVHITGFQEAETYQDYLRIADMAVQLRKGSRGETSRTILDCFSYGIPVIVNNYATFGEFPDNVVCKVSAECHATELGITLHSLCHNETLRKQLGNACIDYLKEFHDPEKIAENYALALSQLEGVSTT